MKGVGAQRPSRLPGKFLLGVFVFENCSFPLAQAQLLGPLVELTGRGGALPVAPGELWSPPPPPWALFVINLLRLAPEILLLLPLQGAGELAADLAHGAGVGWGGSQGSSALMWPGREQDLSSDMGVAWPDLARSGTRGQSWGVSLSGSTVWVPGLCCVTSSTSLHISEPVGVLTWELGLRSPATRDWWRAG